MSTENKNQPAFPNFLQEGLSANSHVDAGLTKREYFAAMAMQGIMSDVHVQLWMKTDPRYNGENFAQLVAINSCEFADALLNQLNQTQ